MEYLFLPLSWLINDKKDFIITRKDLINGIYVLYPLFIFPIFIKFAFSLFFILFFRFKTIEGNRSNNGIKIKVHFLNDF